MNKTDILHLLSELSDFKIVRSIDHFGGFSVSGHGVTYYISGVLTEEALLCAYVFIQARAMARELVKDAKVVLSE